MTDINNSIPKEIITNLKNEIKDCNNETISKLNQLNSRVNSLDEKINKPIQSIKNEKVFLLEILQIADDLSIVIDKLNLKNKQEQRNNKNIFAKLFPTYYRWFNRPKKQNLKESIAWECIRIINKNLIKTLKKYDIFEINPLGKKFDENKHYAIKVEPTKNKDEDDKVSRVIKKGYSWNNEILREAQVIVKQFLK